VKALAFPLAITTLLFGYTLIYAGWSQMSTAGHGVSLLQALTGQSYSPDTDGAGIGGLAPITPSANLTGNTPQTGTPPTTVYA
jgi:hypothetical protein